MGSVKNRRRNKWFSCFRPIAVDEDSFKPDDDSVFTYVSVEGKERMVLPKILTSLSEGKIKDSSDGGGRPEEGKTRRSFSRALKAVLFDTSLAKKVRSRKARQNSNSSNSTIGSEKTKTISNSSVNDHEKRLTAADFVSNSSRCWSSSLNSSSSSTITSTSFDSNPRSSSDRKGSFRASSAESKQIGRLMIGEKVRECYNHSSSVGLCLLLVCLLVLIFWGKVCAILCTSTWFFLVGSRGKRVDSVGHGADSPERDSEEQKKRVIMEGLLQRNRSRVL